jgi:hypothetical protein
MRRRASISSRSSGVADHDVLEQAHEQRLG